MLEEIFAKMFDSDVTNWVMLGLVLSLLELAVPGVYLIWFGLAAFVMSITVYFAPMIFTTQLMWFAAFSAVFAIIGWLSYRWIFKRMQTPKEYQNLNNPAAQHIGETVTLAEDVVDHQTKVKIGDTFWLAYCEKPLKSGDTAKVTGIKNQGMLLIIE
ncbi:MAG: NfeD family protein [Alphaproteobacteria bacterium]|jgi:membrane protein implicated in regulation of membrane protease activity|nr:NfeD family protein [Alphaproteobacteria bacterium]